MSSLRPKDGGWLLFSLCVANRFLSGLSEAAASGADEALAYDSLPEGVKGRCLGRCALYGDAVSLRRLRAGDDQLAA